MKVAVCLVVVTLACSVRGAAINAEKNLRNVLLRGNITRSAILSDVTYYVYNRDHPNNPDVITHGDIQQLFTSSKFDPRKHTFFIIHGWVDSYNADVNRLVKAALFIRFDANIIAVDWNILSSQNYLTARNAVVNVGKFVGTFINDILNAYGLTGDQVTLIGHSLGAHISGNAGSVVQSPVQQIIGLDPASPGFSKTERNDRLDASDGQYVRVIHTNGRFLGFPTSIGDVDYYPNGGQLQAGCGLDLFGGCSHERAFLYLAEGIINGGFTSTLCTSYTDYTHKRCASNKQSNLGNITVDKSITGDYFLNTLEKAPFSRE